MYNVRRPRPDELPSALGLAVSTLVAAAAAGAILIAVVLPAEYGIDPTGLGARLGLTQMGEIKVKLAEEAVADQQQTAAGTTTDPTGAETEASTAETIATAEPDETTATAAVSANALAEAEDAFSDAPAPEETATPASEEAATPELVEEPAEIETAATSATEGRKDSVTFTLAPGEGIEYKLVMQAGAVAEYAWAVEGGVVNYDLHGDGGGQSVSYVKGRGVPGDKGALKAAFTGNHGWFWRNRNAEDVTVTLRVRGDYKELKRKAG